MMQAIRNCLQSVSNGSHAGLILARYLKEQEDSGDKPKRNELFGNAIKAMGQAKPFYEKYFTRWKDSWRFTPGSEKPYRGSMKEFTLENRMIIGLGSDNVLEAGLTLHHTYGVPYVPGSAVKGLCAHYCHELGDDFTDGSELYRTIFGDQTQAGMIQFHDALIDPVSLTNCLHNDVMTPHHRDYYGSPKDNVVAPTEYDSPVPVTFLSVSGKFLFVISCDDKDENGNVSPDAQRWINFVWKLLDDALKNKGLGGKTNSGYGFGMVKDLPAPPPKQRVKEDRETVKRIRQSKGDLLFETHDGKLVSILKDDQATAKKIPIGESIEMLYCGPLGDKLQFKLTPEFREELAK